MQNNKGQNKIFVTLFLLIFSLTATLAQNHFVTRNGKSFYFEGKPYYYIGTNYWYGAILGMPGESGNRQRLLRELDFLCSIGVTNLRIQAGAEGPDNEPYRVTPALQIAPGKYNEQLLEGLDFLLSEMGKRGMHAVLFLNNSWDWSGGFAQYLNWNGFGPIPYPMVSPNTWPEFMKYSGQFMNCENCQKQFFEHVKFIISRTNTYTGLAYTQDPAIMTWEIGNEPRAFSTENLPALAQYIAKTAKLIRQLDTNHLITTGTEGSWGCEGSISDFEKIHSYAEIDYLTMHIWPKNWSWLNRNDISGTLDSSIAKTNNYIDEHLAVARRLNKPIVLEEFGLPRDEHSFSPESLVNNRDKYYENAFAQVIDHGMRNDVLAGANFWGFAGEGRPKNLYWKKGDDYLGDPPNEEQGLNSVFDTDSSIALIVKYNKMLKNAEAK
jgi:mannan endo-1,4-beta-mannosidase